MNKEVMELWVDALRSGEYEQGVHNLCKEGKFCCLGVLCELYNKNNEEKLRIGEEDGAVTYDDYSGMLPHRVQGWAHMLEATGGFKNDYTGRNLSNYNDGNDAVGIQALDFKAIADIIETEYQNL